MIGICKKMLLVPLFGVMLTANASAIAVVDNGTILTGANGLINVTERNFCGLGLCVVGQIADGVEYSLDILAPNSTIAITAFGVSTNTLDPYGNVWAARTGWTGMQISAAAWNATPFSTSGLFSSFFGNDLYVNLFSANPGGGPITTASDALFEFFHFFGSPESQFVAFNANGIVDQSRGTNSVPEPAPLALLGFGLIGIGLMRKRGKS